MIKEKTTPRGIRVKVTTLKKLKRLAAIAKSSVNEYIGEVLNNHVKTENRKSLNHIIEKSKL